MLDIRGPFRPGIAITLPGQATTVVQSLAPGATVYVPGAEYNSTMNLGAMARARDFSFVLNNRDPFVSAILQKTIALLDVPNVKFVAGEMDRGAAAMDRIGAVLVGNLHSSTPDSIRSFCQILRERSPAGTPIHAAQTDSAADHIRSTGRTWSRLLSEAGLQVERDMGGIVASPCIGGELPQGVTLQMTGKELYSLLRGEHSESCSQRHYTSYVQARTIAQA